METDVNDILFDHEPVDVSPNIPSAPDPTHFSDVLLPKNIGKNKAIFKNFLIRIRQNKEKIKKLANNAIQNMKKSNCLQTDDTETVNYNSRIELDD